jgi:hypothetical protein
MLTGCATGASPAADRCAPAGAPALFPAPAALAATTPVDPTSLPGSALRSGLQLLLREHVDLLGYVTAAGLRPGAGSTQSRSAATVLRKNTAAISLALAGCDQSARSRLRAAWAQRSAALWRYGDAVRRGTNATAFRLSLGTLDRRIGRMLAQRFGVDVTPTTDQLAVDTAALLHALDGIGRRDPSWPAAAQHAADAMDDTATSWAQALARRERLPDAPDATPATLRAELTTLLVRPVGALIRAAQSSNAAAPQPSSALRDAAVVLSDSAQRVWSAPVRGNPGAMSGASAIWQRVDQQLLAFTASVIRARPVTELRPMVAALALSEEQLAIAFSRAVPGTSAAAVTVTLQGPTHALLVALRDAVAHNPPAPWDIAASEDGFAGLAAVLAKGVTRLHPDG